LQTTPLPLDGIGRMSFKSCLASASIWVALAAIGLPGFTSSALAETTMIDIGKPDFSGQRYVDIEVTARDPRGLKSIELFVNGRSLERDGLRDIRIRPRDLSRLKNLEGIAEYSVPVRIPAHALRDNENSLSVRAENVLGEITPPARRTFRYRKAKGAIYLVAIGINRYRQAGIPPLKYAENDARAVASYFREKVGVPAENVFELLGKEATGQNIKRLLGVTLQRKAGSDDQVMIFYAGHGVPEFDRSTDAPDHVEKYLLPWDGELDALYATAIPMREIDFLSKRYASGRVVFMLDTCFSGAAAAGNSRARSLDYAMRGLRSVRMDDGFLNRMTSATGRVVLTASGINEASQELDSLRHGVFTYYLLEALKGRADFDADGYVGVTEVHKYLSEKVPPRTNQQQRPAYFMNAPVTGEIVLGRSPQADIKLSARDPWAEVDDLGRLIIHASPSDAEIYVDGKSRGRRFLNTLLTPGAHTVKVVKSGYRTDERTVQINDRSLSSIPIDLKPNRRLIKRSLPPP